MFKYTLTTQVGKVLHLDFKYIEEKDVVLKVIMTGVI